MTASLSFPHHTRTQKDTPLVIFATVAFPSFCFILKLEESFFLPMDKESIG